MLIFTSKQIDELMSIIDMHHFMFIGTNIDPKYLSTEEQSILRKSGIDIDKYRGRTGKIEEAFAFGILSSANSDARVKGMQYKEFKKFISSKNYIPLTFKEMAAIDHLKYQAHADIKTMSDRIKSDLSNIMLDKDKAYMTKFEEIKRDAAIKVVEMRGTVRDMVSEIGLKTGKWEMDLGRMAEYTLHNAYEEGRAAELERSGGEEILVYKDVYPGACKHCIKHYLTAGFGSRPVIFKLSELRANGTNVGKKVGAWQATLGSLHPHCRCTVNELPSGSTWDDEKGRFVMGKSSIKSEKVRNRKKISVKIGDEEYMV